MVKFMPPSPIHILILGPRPRGFFRFPRFLFVESDSTWSSISPGIPSILLVDEMTDSQCR